MGPSGAGQMTKLANQIAVALTLEAAAEALALAESGGLDRARVLEAIGAGAAGSWQLANLGPKIIARDWRPAFSSSSFAKTCGWLATLRARTVSRCRASR